MKLDKGRAKPIAWNTDIPDDSLEARMKLLGEMKAELRDMTKEFKAKTKHLREGIKGLENIVTEEVKQMHKTVVVGNVKAEYIPQVKIKLKKDKNDGE